MTVTDKRLGPWDGTPNYSLLTYNIALLPRYISISFLAVIDLVRSNHC